MFKRLCGDFAELICLSVLLCLIVEICLARGGV